LGEVSQPFHLLVLTTLQTQVPFVSMGRRGSPWLVSATNVGTLSAGFPPWIVPRSNAGRSPLTPLLKCGPPGQSCSSLKSARYDVPY